MLDSLLNFTLKIEYLIKVLNGKDNIGIRMSVEQLSAEDWEEKVLNEEKPVIVDFWHEQCPHCIELNPILERVARDFKDIRFGQLNIRKNRNNFEIAQKYGIMGTPTLKFFCKGRVIGEIIGFRPEKTLRKEIKSILEKAEECLEKSTEIEEPGNKG